MKIFILILCVFLASCNEPIVKNDFYINKQLNNQINYKVVKKSEIGITRWNNGKWDDIKSIKTIEPNNEFSLCFSENEITIEKHIFERYHDIIHNTNDGKLEPSWSLLYSEKTQAYSKEEKDELGFSIWIRQYRKTKK